MKTATTSNPKTPVEKEIFLQDIFRPEERRLIWKAIQRTWKSQEAREKMQLRPETRQ
jgi:hypothetical protein